MFFISFFSERKNGTETLETSKTLLLTGQLPGALEDVHADRLERPLQVALDRRREVLRVVGDWLALEVHGPELDAERGQVRRVLHLAHAARGREQRLRGHTAPVDARAPDVVALDDGDLEAA